MSIGKRYQYGPGIEHNQITIGFLNHHGYLSQLTQMGTYYSLNIDGVDYHVRIDKNTKLSIQQGLLRVNDVIKPDILLSYKTQGKSSYDLTTESLADTIPVHHVTRYPKTLQQLMLNKHMEKYRFCEFDNNVQFKRVGCMCSNTLVASTLALTPTDMHHTHRWIFKPEFGAMSDNIFSINGGSVNIPLLLNRFAGERTDKVHKKNIKILERLVENKLMDIANGGKVQDLNFNEFYNGGLMAQEYVHANSEYRIIKMDSFKYDIYRRLKLNNNSYPYNDDVIYNYPICTIDIKQIEDNLYLHAGTGRLTPEEDIVFRSKNFKGLLECFASPEMNFQFGSIDFFINISNGKYNIGVYEYQPQYGVIDVYPSIIVGYVENILTFLIRKYFKENQE